MIRRALAYSTACVVAVLLTAFAAVPFPVSVAHADIKGTNSYNTGKALRPLVTQGLPLAANAPSPALAHRLAISTADRSSDADKPAAVALAKPATAAVVHSAGAPIVVPQGQPAPARFFTINEVLASRHPAKSDAVHLAAVDPKTVTDAAPPDAPTGTGTEPFGLSTFRAPAGLLWTKWHGVEADIRAAAPGLARCRAEGTQCTLATFRFVMVIKAAAAKQGRARLEEVNRRVNEAIRYTSDIAQWGVPDLWSAPLDIRGKGSFDTGKGDCEDYAIAKYVALREAGVPAKDLRVLLVRDKVVNMGHAVLAARDDGHWLIMDNRFDKLLAEHDANFLMPLFAIDSEGVKLFAAPYANRGTTNQDMIAGASASRADVQQDADAARGE